MTDEQIIKLAQTYFEEDFVEYDKLDNEVINFITSKESLLQFARAIHKNGYCEGHCEGYQSGSTGVFGEPLG